MFSTSTERAAVMRPESIHAATIIAAIACMTLMALPVQCRADQFALLESNARAMQARVDLIQQAEEEICVAYYAVDLGIAPVATLELLRQASCRGVKVRMIVDGLVSRVPSGLENYLRKAGIQIRVYHAPFMGRPDCINQRMHVKCLIVDRQHVIIGSRNLKDEHFGLDQQNYTDCDAYASGSIGLQCQCYFDWLWSQPDVVKAPTNDSLRMDILRLEPDGDTAWQIAWRRVDSPAGYQRLLTQSLVELARRMPIQFHSGNEWSRMSITVRSMDLIHDLYTDKRDRHFEEQIISLVERAGHSILIETPYAVFTPPVCQALRRASQRGVDVMILTNSLATTDRIVAYAAYHNDKRKLITAGVRLYETTGENHFHAKSMVIDQRILTIGSYNFDPRSSRSNLELNLVVCDTDAAAIMTESILRRMCGAAQVRIEHLKVTVGGDASVVERLKMQSARLTATAIRWLL